MVAEQMGEHGSVEDFIFGVVFFISLSLLLTFSKVIRDGKISQLLTQKQGCQVPSKEYQLQQGISTTTRGSPVWAISTSLRL